MKYHVLLFIMYFEDAAFRKILVHELKALAEEVEPSEADAIVDEEARSDHD